MELPTRQGGGFLLRRSRFAHSPRWHNVSPKPANLYGETSCTPQRTTFNMVFADAHGINSLKSRRSDL